MKENRSIKKLDVTNKYIYILFGLIAHCYLIFTSSMFFALENEFELQSTGIKKETIVNYFCIMSIVVLIVSYSSNWTRPVRIEEGLIAFFIYVLINNIVSTECGFTPTSISILSMDITNANGPIANTNTTTSKNEENNNTEKKNDDTLIKTKRAKTAPPPTEEEKGWATKSSSFNSEGCVKQEYTSLYSCVCGAVMIASFMMSARNVYVAWFFIVITIGMMLFVCLLPISCNQYNVTNIDVNIIKSTLFIIAWFINNQNRQIEDNIESVCLKGIDLLYTYKERRVDDADIYNDNLTTKAFSFNDKKSLPSHYEQKQKGYQTRKREDDYYTSPKNLFRKLETLDYNIKERNNRVKVRKKKETKENRIFNTILQCQQKLCNVHKRSIQDRWFGGFFSWKNRFYDTKMQNIFDLAKTLWILTICPSFLFFIFIEYFLILLSIRRNNTELIEMITIVKTISHLYKEEKKMNSSLNKVVVNHT